LMVDERNAIGIPFKYKTRNAGRPTPLRSGSRGMQRIDRTTRGVFPVMVTPFTDEGAVDLASLDRLVDFYLSCGAHGLTVLGMMGEAAKLTPSESRAVLEKILDRVAGRVPVVVGIS